MKLDGIWRLAPRSVEQVQPHTRYFQKNTSVPMSLPGDVHSALIDAQVISDPYWSTDETTVQWVGACDWVASREFEVADELHDRFAILTLTMVDTVAEIRVNGISLGTCQNQFRRWRFDISTVVHTGVNTIEIHFTAPEQAEKVAHGQLTYPVPCTGYPGVSSHRNLVRKTQSQSGWDAGPQLLTMGVYETISLDFLDLGYVESIRTTTERTEDGWIVHVCVAFFGLTAGKLPLSAHIADRGSEQLVSVAPGLQHWTLRFAMQGIEQWMPAGYGKPHLYPLTVKVSDTVLERKVGFRTVSLEVFRENGELGPLTFMVNGQAVFAKGANWIPMDALPSRMSASRYRHLLHDAAAANMNMIRVWGGGMYEHDVFYETCDELGLMVWQDCMFSASIYPATDDFLENVRQEILYQIPRLHDHPSIVLWCGNDEGYEAIDRGNQSRESRDRYLIGYDRLNEKVVGETIRSLDSTRPWWPSSPSNGPLPYSAAQGDATTGDLHCWRVWHEGKPFESCYNESPRFATEFGNQSLSSLAEIATFAPRDEWNITSVVMEHHQKSIKGAQTMLGQIARYFQFPNGFSNLVFLSQVQQAIAVKMAVEYWRSQRPHCMGTLYWHLQDCWPGTSWSSIEYSGRWKLLHYAARRFYAPVLPILYIKDGAVHIAAVNDTTHALDARISVKLRRFDGTKVNEHIYQPHIAAESSCSIGSLPLKQIPVPLHEAYLHVKLSTKDILIENSLFLTQPKRCRLKDPQIGADIAKAHDGFTITLSCVAPAFAVSADVQHIGGTFSDNFFDIRPSASKTLRFRTKERVSVETFKKQLVIYDLFSSYQNS